VQGGPAAFNLDEKFIDKFSDSMMQLPYETHDY
jgi:hypothetical protein